MKRKTRKGKALAFAALGLIGGAVLFMRALPPADPARGTSSEMVADIAPTVVDGDLTIVRDSEFDRTYGGPTSTARQDLEAISGVWEAAMLLVKDHDRFPLPDNAAITAFLQGENPHRVAWIRPGHPSVSAEGELLDRWGRPLFFHRESARRTTFRSAGPDGEMWTDDDIQFPEDDPPGEAE